MFLNTVPEYAVGLLLVLFAGLPLPAADQAGPALVSVSLFIAVLLILLLVSLLTAHGRSVTLRVPARLESIRSLTRIVSELGQEAQLGERTIFHCHLALDEACANIIEHAYANRPGGEIEVFIRMSRGRCTIRLTDFGEPYDPVQVESPRRAQNLEDIRPGGLGLYLIRAVMDEVRYRPGPRGNHLIMIKRCGSEETARASALS